MYRLVGFALVYKGRASVFKIIGVAACFDFHGEVRKILPLFFNSGKNIHTFFIKLSLLFKIVLVLNQGESLHAKGFKSGMKYINN